MQIKLVLVVVLGTAAAGLGAALIFAGGTAQESVPAPAQGSEGPAGLSALPRSDFVSPAGPATTPAVAETVAIARDGSEDRLERFDYGEFEQMSREERRERMREMRAEWEARMDINGDGEIDDDERLDAMLNSPRGQRLLDEFDADGDGMLDETERQALRDQQAREALEREQRRLDQYDTDGDGELSRAEQQAARDERNRQRQDRMRQMSEEFDRDGDGDLNADERTDAWQTLRERREIDAFIGRYDSNGDGQITSIDFNAFLVLYQSANMRADVNRDNTVDTLDVNSFRDMMARAANRP